MAGSAGRTEGLYCS
ncbi:hypothetical protein E2C01_084843 [Portunus trituberculatus]|uniref:Uncharacterized protein n=1 Tax=Portunus trituberculatus TaxID=210409 RepID=A0A5B7IZC3_PORTR|nr:hypothetical protein [Portunus trituberculatus]